jgi:formate dehydrogenase major subunit
MQKVKGMDEPMPEDILREINRSVWTIGYTGQSPERLKAHMKNMHVFDVKTLKAKGGKDKETGYDFAGDYFGLPWPCYGTPELKHPGTPNLYDTSKHVMDGGGNFRANFGVERTACRCWPKMARTRWAPTSPPATPSSTTCCSRSWAGGTS